MPLQYPSEEEKGCIALLNQVTSSAKSFPVFAAQTHIIFVLPFIFSSVPSITTDLLS
ncbi:MAG: hypothetical protein ACP5LG_05430 [Conexivisphaera sp.]